MAEVLFLQSMADAWVFSFRPPYVSNKGDYAQTAQDEIDDSV